MKYVIIQTEVGGVTRVYPFTFSEQLTHAEMGKRLAHAVGWETENHAEIRSAGFCHLHNNEFQTDHGSESLGIKSDRHKGYEDHKILNMPNAMQGILL